MNAFILDENRTIVNAIEVDDETEIPGLAEYIPGLWIGDTYPSIAELHSELVTLTRVVDTLLSI